MKPFISDGGRLLIVDDVWTTGNSARKFRGEHYDHVDLVHYAALFNRSDSRDAGLLTALWELALRPPRIVRE